MLLRKTLLATFCAAALLPLALPVSAAATQQFPSEQGSITVTPIAKGLDHPWA
ncbi:MAG: PQQ-dependent sugar dehydrogenase, partial [Pseudomonas sp.]